MIDDRKTSWTRRTVLRGAGLAAGVWLLDRGGAGRSAEAAEKSKSKEKEEDVSANEDLMREHGLLDRVLLIYEEAERRLGDERAFPTDAVAAGAGIVRRFVEDYHEKQEEEFLFPRLEKANQLRDLTAVLRAQHQAGRRLTDEIQRLSTSAANDPASRQRLAEAMRLFARMYRPHAAREDTVLFPAFHQLLSHREYDSLGEKFEEREHQMFGADGFEKTLDQVAALERQLGIDDLGRFTPP